MVQKIDRQELQVLFLEALSGADYRYVEGLNPFRILLNGTEYWIYIKNLTSAHFENPDVWRAQLPQRDDFNPIKDADADFILLGYDRENDVYATWNPVWVKQRLNSTGNVSFYSRLSLQQQARAEKQLKRMELSNEGEVVVFPRELIRMFFINVKSYFLAEGDYVAMGSKRRPEANEAFKTFTDAANVAEFARYLGDEGMSQVTIGNYCRVIKNLISDGTITRNRKIFYAYDSLVEYRMAIGQFVALDEVKEKNEKWHNLISAALNAYIDFLTRVAPEIRPDDLLPLVEEIFEDEDEQNPEVIPEDEPDDVSVNNLFEYFCSDEALRKFEIYLTPKDYLPATVKRYVRAIKFLINAGMIQLHRDLFDACSSYKEYAGAADKFFSIPDIHALNEHKHHDFSAAMKQYVAFLSETQAYARNEVEPHLLQDGDRVPYGTQTESEPTPEPEPIVHDWEAEFRDENGKLTRIANPELIDILRPYLDTEYPKKAAAFNAIEKFYPDWFSSMTLAEWGKLMNDINWADPYVHDTPQSSSHATPLSVSLEAPKRSKTHILRVEFPDGTVLQERNVSETYAKAIKLIDPELVALVELSHAGVGVVSKTLDSKYAQYQKPIGDGWYVMTNSSTNSKCIDLQTISDELELDLKVYLVPLDGSEITVVPRVDVPEGTRAKIRVTFPNGRVIFPAKVLEALVEVVKYAGAERVRELGIICCGDNLILKNPSPRYQKPSKPVGNGWLCNTYSNTSTKFSQISEISNRLGLDLVVEIL
ncbi:MAG: hypothetical protein J5917_05805 [Bacteroidales bacterium]|nr:hypothetical protein [Bacteroidales bacterium]MBP3235618.1 hypothetical protein [Bacteroidales bacterium]